MGDFEEDGMEEAGTEARALSGADGAGAADGTGAHGDGGVEERVDQAAADGQFSATVRASART